MEPDPIGLEGGSNPYAYAGNNPISSVDPSGIDDLALLSYGSASLLFEARLASVGATSLHISFKTIYSL